MATATQEAELKLQGAIEAAQNPESQVTADDAERKIVEDSTRAGVLAFHLDTNATAEERLAQAREAIPDGFRNKRRPKGISLVTDLDDDGSVPVEPLPEATNADVIEVAKDQDGKPIPEGEAEKEPPYLRTGWAPQLGWPHDDIKEADSLLDHQTFLEGQMPDHLFGDWYHNAGVIVFACLMSWLVAVLGGGIGWVFILMAICGTYYRTSLRRVRRNFRDDVMRELSLKRLETENESVEWINAFLLKFWPIYQPVLAQTVINSVDQVLSASTPGFLDSLKLKTFTLGSKPPRMEHVKTLQAEDDYVIMDWMFSFTPNDTADMTAKQIKNRIQPKVVLEIRVGKAMISKGLDVIVENMSFSGLMRIKMKLQIPFPHIDRIEMSFLERPMIDYVCKPLGGDTFGFDINFIPGLESFIQEQIHATLAPMMYAPNVFPIELAKMLAGTPVDQAIGVVSITLHGAHGLKNSDNFGSIDPFAQLSLNRRQPLAKTKVVHDTSNPRWNETLNIIVTSFNDRLDIEVIDHNEFRKSKLLGVASFALEHFEEFETYENERLEVISDGKARGVVSCDIRFFPVLEGNPLPDGTLEPPPETNQGILRFTVEQAKDLDGTKSLVGLLNPYAVLLVNGRPVHTTKKLKRTNNPIWDNGYTDVLIHNRKHAKLGVMVKDDRDIAGDQHLGAKQIKLDDLMQNMEQGKEWYYLDGPNSGRVKMMAQWKPVNISGIAGGTGGYVTPIGVMRLHCKRAVDLRNFETMGKSDPYLRVLQSGIERSRTVTFKNNLNPEWDEVLYIPVHNTREKLVLEVMDSEKVGKDRSLGSTVLNVGEFVNQLESGEYETNDEKVTREAGLRLEGKKSTEKGTIVFTVAFYPCLNIADPEDEDEENDDASDSASTASGQRGANGNGAVLENGSNSIDLPRSPASGSFPPISPGAPRKSGELTLPRSPTGGSSPTSPRKSREEPKGPPLVHLTPQELLQHETGLVLVRLLEAELPRSNSQIEIYVDQATFPSYTSSPAKSRHHTFEEIGDCFIRELDCSTLTLKVREKGDKVDDDDKDKDHTLAYLTGETLSTLKQCLVSQAARVLVKNRALVQSLNANLPTSRITPPRSSSRARTKRAAPHGSSSASSICRSR
jgi:Ca2+-dependent lipid-binding protein